MAVISGNAPRWGEEKLQLTLSNRHTRTHSRKRSSLLNKKAHRARVSAYVKMLCCVIACVRANLSERVLRKCECARELSESPAFLIHGSPPVVPATPHFAFSLLIRAHAQWIEFVFILVFVEGLAKLATSFLGGDGTANAASLWF